MTGLVRLNLFAGRPDFEWTIPDAEMTTFVDDITALPIVASHINPSVVWGSAGRPRIGYHGLTLTVAGNGAAPYRVDVFDQFIVDTQAPGVRGDHGRAIERRLYATAPPAVVVELDNLTFEQLIEPGNEMPINGLNPSPPMGMRCETGPSSRASSWIRFKDSNNCYNFANDTLIAADFRTPAMPGALSHVPVGTDTQKFKKILQEAIEKDGLIRIADDRVPSTCPVSPFHYMAVILLQLPGNARVRDFHCLRLDIDGTWWHKSGTQEPRNTDDAGGGPVVIQTLSNAVFAGFPVLVGVYRAIKNNPRVK